MSNGTRTFASNCANRTAPHNSNRGTLIVFTGATRDFAHNRRVTHDPWAVPERRYTAAPYARSEASAKPCTSTLRHDDNARRGMRTEGISASSDLMAIHCE